MSTHLTAMAARMGWACETFEVPIEALPDRVAEDYERHQAAMESAAIMATAAAMAEEIMATAGLPPGMTLEIGTDLHPWQRSVLERIQQGPGGEQIVVDLPRRNA